VRKLPSLSKSKHCRSGLKIFAKSTIRASESFEKPFSDLDDSCQYVKTAPASEKVNASSEVLNSMNTLKTAGAIPKWGSALSDSFQRRNVFLGELKQIGISSPEKLATPSVRNDAAFLATTVVSTSALAVASGVLLPGDWGFFVPYLIGSISLVVLGIGSTAPGLLEFIINRFSQVFPDFRERCARHEAAHFLVGYLLGVPVVGYSLDVGQAHTDFAEAKLQSRLIERRLTDAEVDALAVVAMAGVAAEGLKYDEVLGQNGDLSDLQRILRRSEAKLSDAQQQNITRWAAFQAASILRSNREAHERLMEAMQQRKPVSECVRVIEEFAQ